MIGAIRYKTEDDRHIVLYKDGTPEEIDFEHGHGCSFGDNFEYFDFLPNVIEDSPFAICTGLDGQEILRLTETKQYILQVDSEGSKGNVPVDKRALWKGIEPHFLNENNKFLKVHRNIDSVSFQFINYLGRSRISFGGSVKQQIIFEVVPDKINYEDDYISLTEALADECSELLLDYAGATTSVFSLAQEDHKTLMEQFIFLRKFCYEENIRALFESIKRNPDKILHAEEEYKPLGYGMPSHKFYTNPFSYAKGWHKVDNPLPGQLSILPSEVAVTRKYDSLDTPANRFIRYALQKFDDICCALIETLSSDASNKQTECLAEAKFIHETLDEIFNDEFFKEIGPMDILPQNDQVLQKREGYAQIFQAYSMVDLALQLDWKGNDTVYEGEAKNVALLYEYWLFFELRKIIKSIDGCNYINDTEDSFINYGDGKVNISLYEEKKTCQSFEIERLHTKVNLYYNRTFSPTEFKSTSYEGSYSRPFRPDYTIAVFPDRYKGRAYNGENQAIEDGSVSYIHFDAKYRITDLTAFIGKTDEASQEEELREDKADSVLNTYKRGDLLKMHTYNDAIRRTVGSFVLYPGSGNDGKAPTFKLYDEILPGVGAFAIKPSNEKTGEDDLRKYITWFIEAKNEMDSRMNRMKYYSEMVIQEPAVTSLDARDSKAKDEQEEDSAQKNTGKCVVGYIRSGSTASYYDFLKNNGFLRQGGKFLFYFYAIKGNYVYPHHSELFKTADFRFFTNNLTDDNGYVLEPVLGKIKKDELISKEELVKRLSQEGYETEAKNHHADFYYILQIEVVDDNLSKKRVSIAEMDGQNGNDSFSAHSPKLLNEN